jgi:hypothetical protein
MIWQMLSDDPLKEFEQVLVTCPTEMITNSNHSLDSATNQIFPSNP